MHTVAWVCYSAEARTVNAAAEGAARTVHTGGKYKIVLSCLLTACSRTSFLRKTRNHEKYYIVFALSFRACTGFGPPDVGFLSAIRKLKTQDLRPLRDPRPRVSRLPETQDPGSPILPKPKTQGLGPSGDPRPHRVSGGPVACSVG